MNETQFLTKASIPNWVKIIFITLIGLGIFFRFAHLEQKLYCCDENWTSVAISGHTLAELKEEFSHHQGIIPITAFDKYQQINPDRGVGDTVNYLITSDSQHPPLYYVMVRLWAQVFGDSPTGVRSLSALISLLIFPAVYWLCLELFDSTVVGWVAMVLIAVSPLQLFFAQEARQYSLWMGAILVSSAALLRAIKQESKKNWVVYTLSLALGLYTHLFMVLVIMCHGIYVIIQEKFRFTKALLNYLLSTIASLLILLPWVIVVVTNIDIVVERTQGWSVEKINPLELITIFLIRLTRTFFDINSTSEETPLNAHLITEGSLYYIVPTLILSLLLLSYLIFLILKIPKNKHHLLIYLLAVFPSVLLIIYDILLGGIHVLQIRYLLPLHLSIVIIVAHVLAFQILQERTWSKNIAKFIIISLLIAGLLSDITFFKANNWWIQGSDFILEVEKSLNQSEKPLLAINDSGMNLGTILSLTGQLKKFNLLLVKARDFSSLLQEYKQIDFIDNNSTLFHQLQQDKTYTLKVIRVLNPPPGGLWQFEKLIY